VGEFEGMGALEDLTPRVKDWKHHGDILPIAWQTVTIKNKIASLPWVVTNDGVYYRTDRLKEYGLKAPKRRIRGAADLPPDLPGDADVPRRAPDRAAPLAVVCARAHRHVPGADLLELLVHWIFTSPGSTSRRKRGST
jgi:hypothetical protein